jgi:putative endonuclease
MSSPSTSERSSTGKRSSNTKDRRSLGKQGEAWAAAYLEQVGYRLVAANFTIPVGRNLRGTVVNAEIDLVAYDGPTLCFIEVKTRASDWFAPPQTNVDRRKQRQVARAARAYRQMLGLAGEPYRFDVVTVVLKEGHAPEIELLRNFWREDQFRKRTWTSHFYD